MSEDTNGTVKEEMPKTEVVAKAQRKRFTATEKLRIQSTSGVWGARQAILLCSDGLLDECNPAFLHEIISDMRISAQEAAEQLLFQALQGDAGNNITAVLLRMG